MAPKVKLVYFNMQGKGEIIRILLHSAKIEFEDKRVERVAFSEWKDLKPTTVFGQLPILYWDGLEIPQSGVITRFVAKKAGLAGNTEEEQLHAEMILEHVNDLIKEYSILRNPPDLETKKAKAVALVHTFLPTWLAHAEKFLKARGGEWYASSGLTYADIAMQVMLDRIMCTEERSFQDLEGVEARFTMLENCPLVKANYEKVLNIPEIKAYLQNRPASNPPGL